jgi:hydrogenase-4 component E
VTFAPLPPLVLSLASLLVIAALLLSFVLLGSHWIRNHITAYAVQSWTIALLSVVLGVYGRYPELFLIAAITALFRGTLLPYLLERTAGRLGHEREFRPFLNPASSMVIGGLLILVAYAVAHRLGLDLPPGFRRGLGPLGLTALFAVVLIGFLLLFARTGAFSAVLGLLVIENGIFLGSLILVPGMPVLLELVILFDLLVIVTTFGVLIRYLQQQARTTSSRELTRLTE